VLTLAIDVISQFAQGNSANFLKEPDMGHSISTMLRDSVVLHPVGRTFPTLVAAMLKF